MDIADVRRIFPEPNKSRSAQYAVGKKSKPKQIIKTAERMAVIKDFQNKMNVEQLAKKYKRAHITIQEIIEEGI